MELIRRAEEKDINDILKLLEQVNLVHYLGRPDIFKPNTKYNYDELVKIINNNDKVIFVYEMDNKVVGYCFTIKIQHLNNNLLTDIKTLYIDDLCVDKEYRGNHIGESLYKYVLSYAKEQDYYNIELNVWELNKGAKAFYKKLGLTPLKTTLEQKI